jgi:hypothetical protein
MKPLRRVVLALVVLVAALLATASSMRALGPRAAAQAVAQSQSAVRACEQYRNHPANPDRGKYPTALADLAKQPFIKDSFLLGGEEALRDPWGNPYRYAVVKNATSEDEVYVWSERLVDGKLKLLGAKRTANGEIEKFGLPE